MDHYSDPEFINIGCGSDLEIRELAEMVRRIVGFSGEIVWDTSKPDGTPRKWMDSSRIFSLGWKPRIDMDAGIRLAYADYLRLFALSANPSGTAEKLVTAS